MLRNEGRSVIALAFSNPVAPANLIRLRINYREDILELQIYVHFPGKRVVLRHPGFAVEMHSLDDLVLLHIDNRLCFAAFIRDVKLVEGSCVRDAGGSQSVLSNGW